eukprot:GHVU01126495.1.p2 GENE.GHVU01126495.1~~GHVU01126495.1.p2  ORF type:complete len:188 (+),score=26.32 GHVU01126495.1:231-794(+)
MTHVSMQINTIRVAAAAEASVSRRMTGGAALPPAAVARQGEGLGAAFGISYRRDSGGDAPPRSLRRPKSSLPVAVASGESSSSSCSSRGSLCARGPLSPAALGAALAAEALRDGGEGRSVLPAPSSAGPRCPRPSGGLDDPTSSPVTVGKEASHTLSSSATLSAAPNDRCDGATSIGSGTANERERT